AGALAFAHRNGVVHRDVKPGNILLTPQGQVKVTDFGIARAGGASEGLTQTGSVMGTATYFSPEQAQGLPVDARSDVYSLGIVLYEMVCAVPPFSGDSPIAVAYKHVREEPPRPTVVNPDVPRELEEIILTALAKTPEERYPSADDLRADLARFRRGEQPNAVPGLVVQAVPVSGTEPTTVTPKAVDHTRVGTAVAPAPPPKKRSAWPFVLVLVALLGVLAGLGYLLADQLQGDGGGSVTVDEYVGLTLDEARLLIERDGLEVDPKFEISDDHDADEVFRQDPDPGTKLDPGDTVTLTVSQGRGKAAIPDVSGQTLDEAEKTLEDAGFETRIRQEASDSIEKGKVIRTEPAAAGQAERGSEVTIFVSTGQELVAVPDVAEQSAVSASNQLGAAGFKVESVSEASDEVEEGTVIRTDPAAGTQAPKGSTVRLVVSSGQEEVRVPSVVNMTASE
ncbi:MAG: PASTA domain-containing protein, partial [Acidimicrobiia bacterium]